jgi:hypothetical protein
VQDFIDQSRSNSHSVRCARIRLLELLGPGDPGHANHWHVAFATEQQDPNDDRPLLRDENWIVTADARGSAPPIFLGPKRPAPARPLNRPTGPAFVGRVCVG